MWEIEPSACVGSSSATPPSPFPQACEDVRRRQAHGAGVIGVVLTGCGDDGASGLIAIKAAGGLSLVQDPSGASHGSMPAEAIRRDDVDGVLTIAELAMALPRLEVGGWLDTDRARHLR